MNECYQLELPGVPSSPETSHGSCVCVRIPATILWLPFFTQGCTGGVIGSSRVSWLVVCPSCGECKMEWLGVLFLLGSTAGADDVVVPYSTKVDAADPGSRSGDSGPGSGVSDLAPFADSSMASLGSGSLELLSGHVNSTSGSGNGELMGNVCMTDSSSSLWRSQV